MPVTITFSICGENAGIMGLIPFDVKSRLLANDEWQVQSKGAIQPVKALKIG